MLHNTANDNYSKIVANNQSCILLGSQFAKRLIKLVRSSEGTNVHFQHLKVPLLKQTNVRMFVLLGLLNYVIMENSLENYVLTYTMTLSVLTPQEKYRHSITVQVKM